MALVLPDRHYMLIQSIYSDGKYWVSLTFVSISINLSMLVMYWYKVRVSDHYLLLIHTYSIHMVEASFGKMYPLEEECLVLFLCMHEISLVHPITTTPINPCKSKVQPGVHIMYSLRDL